MRLRLILPPNLEACLGRDAIPTKLEFALPTGQTLSPEKTSQEQLASLDDAGRAAAFALLQWCDGRLGSFLQLDREKLAQLLATLRGEPVFFWANRPQQPIGWTGSTLPGVSSLLSAAEPTPSEAATAPAGPMPASPPPEAEWDYDGAPLEVDGSEHYLSVRLPSREHPCYERIRELLETRRFKLEPSNRKWWLRDRHQVLNFLGEFWSDLEERFHAEFSANFRRRLGHLPEAEVSTEVVEERNGYRVSLSIEAGGASERDLSQSLATGRHYIESGGQTYLLKASRLRALQEAQRKLSGRYDAPLLHQGVYSIPFARAAEVEESLDRLNPNFEPPSAWRARSEALRNLSRLPQPELSPQLASILRPYQRLGVAWLHHLFQHQLGGILADEMGLGKTLQALALLAALKRASGEASPLPSLIVCPASLVENWRREAARFTPELAAFVNHGSRRLESPEQLRDYDLIITSYGTLIRDQELLSSVEYRCVIGDEAQHIKNRRTQNAKAITSLTAQGRILLTGTPVENSIQDLMSLLDFIMPGGWKPIPEGARGDERRWHEQRILEQAAPYILRRSKRAVAKELPEKIEQVLFLDMTEKQRAVYERTRQAAEREIAQMEQSGASEGAVRMRTLTQLLRLRQACCDPRLVDDRLSPETSTKLASFSELLHEAMDGGHRILVFSQFVSLLTLLRETLEVEQIPYCYIDGSTRNRMAEVDRFNNSDSIPLFLISLKAGGTGLNLTAADTVVHFDPWWNPAAEAQATDRAHRIGQTRVVTSYKLIVAESVEEKVLQLQSQKRQLLENIFEASEAANARIDLQDLKQLIA